MIKAVAAEDTLLREQVAALTDQFSNLPEIIKESLGISIQSLMDKKLDSFRSEIYNVNKVQATTQIPKKQNETQQSYERKSAIDATTRFTRHQQSNNNDQRPVRQMERHQDGTPITCRGCGLKGHSQQNCRYSYLQKLRPARSHPRYLPNAKKLESGLYESSHRVQATVSSILSRVGPKLLTHAVIYGQRAIFQIDTGAQVSCLPYSLIPSSAKSSIIPSTIQLQAYNGQTIQVYGCLATDIHIGEIQLKNCLFQIVSEHCKPILGTPKFENGLETDLENGILKKDNQQHLTICDSKSAGIKIISKSSFFTTSAVAARSITIQPRSSAFIDIKLSACPTSFICALPERVSKNKSLEVYDQCLQLSSLKKTTRIQVSSPRIFLSTSRRKR
jgi:hypothetical protein